uniref:Uncharacterized protein n=1 Tax=Romanomermis culicivorax TaxID=13658 RepID=A0A915IVG4_ROMCU
MQLATFLLLLILCNRTSSVNSAVVEETSNEEKSKEAIRLWIIQDFLKILLVEPELSESEARTGKQLLDQVRTGEPEFNVGLLYNITADIALEMFEQFRAQQLISNNSHMALKNDFEQKQVNLNSYTYLKAQTMSKGLIDVKELTTSSHEPTTVILYYAFCKVAYNVAAFERLTNEQQSDVGGYLVYAMKKEWLKTSGPYARLLQEKYQAHRKYLPESFGRQT